MKTHEVLGVIAVLFFCCVFSIAALKLPNLTFNSDVLAIFPNDQSSNRQAEIAQSQMSDFISNRLFLLVPAPEFSKAYEKAQHISQVFSKSSVVESIKLEQDAQNLDSLLQLYRKYSTNFLTAQNRASIVDSASKFIDKNIRRVYMTPSGMGSEAFLADPFSTAEQFVKKISQLQSSKLNFNEGVLSVEDNNVHYVFLQITLAQSAYTLSVQSQVIALLNDAHDYMRSWDDGVELLASGVVQFAAAGAAQAKSEISIVGGGSIIGIVILLLLIFRSTSVLLLSALPIVLGILTGVVACLLVFGQIHVIAMVFGASLIGVSIDYTFHFLITRLSLSNKRGLWSAERGVKRLFNGLTLGLVTSASAYASFMFSGFPGFEQIALFSSAGLVAAYLTVIGIFPFVLSAPHKGTSHGYLFSLCQKYLTAYREFITFRNTVIVSIVLLGVFVLGGTQLRTVDDIRVMQTPEASLLEENKRFQALTGQKMAYQFFLVSGSTAETMLQRLEGLHKKLEGLSVQSKSIAQWLPSIAAQKISQEIFTKNILNTEKLQNFLARLNVQKAAEHTIIANQWSKTGQYLGFSKGYSNVSQVAQFPSYFEFENKHYALVLLDDAQQVPALAAIAQGSSNIQWIDRVSDTNDLLEKFRVKSSHLLIMAFAGILIFLSFRYNPLGALQVILPPLLAACTTLALFGVMHIAINVFNIMALLLVLGIGIDYSLFLRESRDTANETILAISLSALTTLLSFGLLALSETEAIKSFGLTILLGISCCFIFAPLVLYKIKFTNAKNKNSGGHIA